MRPHDFSRKLWYDNFGMNNEIIKSKKSNNMKMIKKRHHKRRSSPYAKIDWEKAADLFLHTRQTSSSKSIFPQVKQILHILAVAGKIGLIFAFPGAGAAIGSLFLLGDREYPTWKVKKTLGQLQKQKYVSIYENPDGSTSVKITHQGLSKALTYKLDSMEINKPKVWDKKWRVVVFDIPEKQRKLRNIFRNRLGQLDLYQLQESVYVSPYPCFREIEFLRELYGVAFKVRYLLVDKIEDDNQLITYFSLN